MFPSMVCPFTSSQALSFFFLCKQTDLENGLVLGGKLGKCRTELTVDTGQKVGITAVVLSSADAALRRSMKLRRMMKSTERSKPHFRSRKALSLQTNGSGHRIQRIRRFVYKIK